MIRRLEQGTREKGYEHIGSWGDCRSLTSLDKFELESSSISTSTNRRWTTNPTSVQSNNLNCLSESTPNLSHQDYHLHSIRIQHALPYSMSDTFIVCFWAYLTRGIRI
ncbi:hypothetical protein K435DRAFT_288854 [Dendrothele bispora CBS 962.96]|uniref:Uncharacterized protein n=1 Tax=Dendrothele bispora (strain CBS 962.96) TaxID=1314807 RepID=A0A4S8KIW5_DENBC|nr:hypothetical protein K435DRAFT_288854 [Dendrothele bispora CBS 962.96]